MAAQGTSRLQGTSGISMDKTDGSGTDQQQAKKRPVIATPEQISRAPIGNHNHRIWKCPTEPIHAARSKWARKEDMLKGGTFNVAGHP